MKNKHRIWPNVKVSLSKNEFGQACTAFSSNVLHRWILYSNDQDLQGELDVRISWQRALSIHLPKNQFGSWFVCTFPKYDSSEAYKGDTRTKRTYGILGSGKLGMSSASNFPSSKTFLLSSSWSFQLLTNSRRSNHEQELHFCLKDVSYSSSSVSR